MGLIERMTVICIERHLWYEVGDRIEAKFSEDAVNYYLQRTGEPTVFPKSKFKAAEED